MNKVSLTPRGTRLPAALMFGSALLLCQSSVLAQVEPATAKEAPATPPTAPEAVLPAASATPASNPNEGAVAPPASPTPIEPTPMVASPQATAVASPQASSATDVSPSSAELSSEQIDAQAQELAEEMSASKVNLYGFVDFTYAQGLSDRSNFVQYVPYPSFYVGNLNLYLDSDLGKNWRT